MLITTENELKKIIAKASQAPAVALDTEFVWERTFYPILGLVQLAVKEECYMIDPVAVKDLSPLGELLSDPSVTKILHDAQQDLTILRTATGADPRNIFDTRLAYGFCGANSILSLANLLEETLQVRLAKTETRSNWLMRPLTDKMVDYACDDVKYLTGLMDFIMGKAEKQGTVSWLKEEMEIFDSPELYAEIDPREAFRKIKGIDQLKGAKLAVLRELAAWRELVARRKDRPRGHIVHNNVLVTLACKCPRTFDDLKKINHLSPKAGRNYGEVLLNCIEKGISVPPELRPVTAPRLSLQKAATAIFNAVQQKAAEFNLDPALVCSRKELNIMLASRERSDYTDSRLFTGWRAEFMRHVYENPAIKNLLSGYTV